jgi:tRNA uridine 5-carboxymethylaminomethyl modification enzyme
MSDSLNEKLVALGTSPMTSSLRIVELLKRPQLNFENLIPILPDLAERVEKVEQARRFEIVQAAEILIKYEGYIKRESELAEKQTRLEYVRFPKGFSFANIDSISIEARQKLDKIHPTTIGQASRIPGVSPADINVLLLLIGR